MPERLIALANMCQVHGHLSGIQFADEEDAAGLPDRAESYHLPGLCFPGTGMRLSSFDDEASPTASPDSDLKVFRRLVWQVPLVYTGCTHI